MKVIKENGKRKTAIARAIVREGNGEVRVNSQLLDAVSNPFIRVKISEPLRIAGDLASKVRIDIDVHGGGFMGQAEASSSAIAKGLDKFFENEELKQRFLDYDRALLVDDTRRMEPKRYGGPGARAKRQKSYR